LPGACSMSLMSSLASVSHRAWMLQTGVMLALASQQ
jgi:hypothetical protein